MTTLTTTQLAEIEARADAATPVGDGGVVTAEVEVVRASDTELTVELEVAGVTADAVLAAGAASVQQIDLQMGISPASLPIPMPAAVLAQATGTKTAVIGAKSSGCYKNPMPIPFPATVTMKVAAGSGIAGVQVYAK